MRSLRPAYFFIALVLPLSPSLADDACSAVVPAKLAAVAASAFPGYRAPRDTDNLAEDVSAWAKNGKGCISAVKGDFYGDGMTSYLLAMTSMRSNNAGVVVAARGVHDKWQFETLETLSEGRNRLFLDRGRPGTYHDGGSENSGAGAPLFCTHDVVLMGATEAGEAAYCRLEKGWRHVVLSD